MVGFLLQEYNPGPFNNVDHQNRTRLYHDAIESFLPTLELLLQNQPKIHQLDDSDHLDRAMRSIQDNIELWIIRNHHLKHCNANAGVGMGCLCADGSSSITESLFWDNGGARLDWYLLRKMVLGRWYVTCTKGYKHYVLCSTRIGMMLKKEIRPCCDSILRSECAQWDSLLKLLLIRYTMHTLLWHCAQMILTVPTTLTSFSSPCFFE